MVGGVEKSYKMIITGEETGWIVLTIEVTFLLWLGDPLTILIIMQQTFGSVNQIYSDFVSI
jgi:hypothetical protein